MRVRDQLHQISLTDSLYNNGTRNDSSRGPDEPRPIEGSGPEEKEDDVEPGSDFRSAPSFLNPAEDMDEDIEIQPENMALIHGLKG